MLFVLQGRKFTVHAPSDFSKEKSEKLLLDPPEETLILQHVFGYRGRDTSDNVHFTADGRIVCFSAAVVMVIDCKTNKQELLTGHSDDILSVAIHPKGTIVATGQLDPLGKAEKAFALIWDVTTYEEIGACRGFHDAGISALAFSLDGSLLITCGADTNHSVAVWDWRKGRVLCSAKGGNDKITDVRCGPNNTFYTCGSKQMYWWSMDQQSRLVRRKGVFGKKGELQSIPAVCCTEDGYAISATAKTGHVYIWKKNDLMCTLPPIHKGMVTVVRCIAGGFITAGRDGKVCIWQRALGADWAKECRLGHVVETGLDIRAADLRLDAEVDTHLLVVGTATNQLVEINCDAFFDKRSERVLIDGHYGETWGLATHPSKHHFVTASDDKSVRIWDIDSRRLIAKTMLHEAAHSASYSPDAKHIAVGLKDGGFVVLLGSTLAAVQQRKERKMEVSDIKYSPDNSRLAVASHDMTIDIYAVHSSYRRIGTCKGHSSFITHIDWSEDSRYLMSNSGDYELLYWDAENATQIADTVSMRDVPWCSYTCVLGWPVTGIWPPFADGTDVNAVCRSPSNHLLASGDDFFRVRLFRFPCISNDEKKKMAPHKSFIGHSSHVTNVRFSYDNKYLISIGGNDCTVLLWEVIMDSDDEDESEEEEEKSSEKPQQRTRSLVVG
eukprot:CAMPEP_0184336236 /NCGR_PEP_ID=MMETSP1089-20130417/4606_1 /TAXON_ID=38269 ORGANISM="Gloeochaete wittrockiana, Strain SAG46.84" /NCGR_SAMPLE_ID=MMETSP1089 /ASSEMBLY_ACC=CAM_ASM_000445 /LENGTH=666 /DNA_ID=CAMNT_0026661207 /DNA_START=116 /DNA_END=2113 /DNA_ORIENTATION=-